MSIRYFFDEPIALGRVMLTGPEAHHLIHVMRAAPGEEIILFDGHGAEFAAVIQNMRRSEVELLVLSRQEVDRELPIEITLGIALPKGDRQKWLIEKAVELGVACIVPLHTERAVAQPVDQAISRLRRSVIEASKQCGRNRLMRIDPSCDWSDFLQKTAAAPCRLLAHPRLDKSATVLPSKIPDRVILAIGPEGGFTEAEVSSAISSGWRPVDLGSRILRVETAALAMAVMVISASMR
jgi:16S rRNA (uracil1498-N3)-methyltransferase